jgi:hypothetical protein
VHLAGRSVGCRRGGGGGGDSGVGKTTGQQKVSRWQVEGGQGEFLEVIAAAGTSAGRSRRTVGCTSGSDLQGFR